ncbi:MAG TPA: tRNA pseudouridine(38-40) synthase TruA [Planctomycetota bacterium]|jgi:tRNA pseudouridine38-40 synthase
MPRRIKLTLEYDGTDFKGWQVQCGGPAGTGTGGARTVQGVVERALLKVAGQPIRIAGASRTDTGVHALEQVASFLLPDEVLVPTGDLCMALNANMDKDVAARRAEDAALDFHAQRDSSGKIYAYSIVSGRCRAAFWRRTHWHAHYDLKIDPMRKAAEALIGRHNFTSFATKLAETQEQRAEEGKQALDTTKEIRRLELCEDPGYPGRVVMHIEGSGFLYQMVRTIAGSLVDVGRGFRPPEWMAEALAAHDRRRAGPTAPPHGLCLLRVLY